MAQSDAVSVEVKISTVVAVAVKLRSAHLSRIKDGLERASGGSADFFDNQFAVIDIGELPAESRLDWPVLLKLLRSYQLNPVAVRNAPRSMVPAIRAIGLSIDDMPEPRLPEPVAVPQAVVAEVSLPDAELGPLVVDVPVRAGQRVYARNRDLIVTEVVNNGAELIADGSIHVYAPLKGRALAGARGNVHARIFASSLEAELVSIAGVYRTFAEGVPEGFADAQVQCRLRGSHLDIEPIFERARL